eukprot:16436458-Heterocapsa_arctica.AAC.1
MVRYSNVISTAVPTVDSLSNNNLASVRNDAAACAALSRKCPRQHQHGQCRGTDAVASGRYTNELVRVIGSVITGGVNRCVLGMIAPADAPMDGDPAPGRGAPCALPALSTTVEERQDLARLADPEK